ncbi:MAG: FtsX-like permease family protein [Lachnospiraceae bacterium]|nr:FtsX-like permease family protein [Lachnospiraceae bacterium]
MNKKIFASLAFDNMKKNRGLYLPYILTGMVSVAMFFILLNIALDPGLYDMILTGGRDLSLIMRFGASVIGIFTAIIIFYANSFLMKRRKTELGLYNVLGLEKRHISRIMFLETIYVCGAAVGLGIVLGAVFEKLVMDILLRILDFDVHYGFKIIPKAVVVTLIVYLGIFLIILIYNIIQILVCNPLELMSSAKAGEREPKSKWLSFIMGLAFLGAGYYIALTTKDALAAIGKFFIAVMLVIAGTYFLFTVGSIVLLKALKKNKNYYYNTKHFVSVSQMIYRMKKNAAGLAAISILSAMVLVTLSTTVAMYVGIDNEVDSRYPNDLGGSFRTYKVDDNSVVEEAFKKAFVDTGLTLKNLGVYSSISGFYTYLGEGRFEAAEGVDTNTGFFLIPYDNLPENVKQKFERPESSELYIFKGSSDFGDVIRFADKEYTVKGYLPPEENSPLDFASIREYCFYGVCKDENEINEIARLANFPKFINIYADFNESKEVQKEACGAVHSCYDAAIYSVDPEAKSSMADYKASAVDEFLSMYGGLFFLGIFLGMIFILGTALIIYYKQISEGFEDRNNFQIMEKVGMENKEIKGCIQSQVLTVFFLPVGVAVVHVLVASKMLRQLLKIFNLTDASYFFKSAGVVLVVFLLFYGLIYLLTSRVYLKIVK